MNQYLADGYKWDVTLMFVGNLLDGIYSRIPLCCILWYTCGWERLRHEKKMFWGKMSHDWMRNAGYVPCPECLVKIVSGKMKPVKLRKGSFKK